MDTVSEQLRLVDLLDDLSGGKDIFFQSVRLVSDIMTENVKVLTLDDTIGTCIKFMEENHIRHIPVIDNAVDDETKKRLVGIVSERDVFRQISPYLGKLGEEDSDLKAISQSLVQIVTRNPKSVSPETPIEEMLPLMIDNHIDILPVLAGQDLIGIVTSTDILKLFMRLDTIRRLCSDTGKKKQGERLVDMLSGNSDSSMLALSSVLGTVEDIMTEQVVCLERDENLTAAIDAMQEGKFRHVPVVGKEEKLVGIISDRNILRHLPFHGSQFQPVSSGFRSMLFNIKSSESAINQSLNHIMTLDVVHVLPTCDFYDAVRMLYEGKISCLPVIDKCKKVIGIVTTTDVMRGLLAAYKLFGKFTD